MLKYNIGEDMINPKNVEIVYDVLNDSAMLLYETNKTPYLKGIVFTCENILSQEVTQDVPDDVMLSLLELLQKVKNVSFEKEEIRKAMQLCILKGFKHAKIGNQEMTPDTIGIFTAYLVDRLFPKEKELLILDPLVGTGNYLTTIANNIDKLTTLVGIENHPDQYEIARAMFDMMDYGDELYFQDSKTFWNLEADLIVCDFSMDEESEDGYFPYEIIRHHQHNLKQNGYFLGVIYNDFFEKSTSTQFREELMETFDILGLIKLPDNLFKGLGKSLLLLQKRIPSDDEEKQFLLANIPSFEEEIPFQNALLKINLWFENRKRKLGE